MTLLRVRPAWMFVGLALTLSAQAQDASVRGLITDVADGQPLQGVNVALLDRDGTLRGNVTNDDGLFIVVRLLPGEYVLRASYIGYQTFVDTLQLGPGASHRMRIVMATSTAIGDELLVVAEREGGATVTAGIQTVRPRDIDLVPTTDVSGDLVSYLATMPGVISIGDRGGQVFIRGGEPSHNLSLLDGMYLYQPFHILGFYSAFSSDILRNADIHAGAFSSKYSGRMSSVIDVHTRNGNSQKMRRTISLAPFVSMGLLEGPILKGTMSFLFSARASTVEQMASHYVSQPLPYNFGDFFGKIHTVINESNQFSFSAIHTYDRGTLGQQSDNPDEIRWNNTAYGLRYLIAPPSLPILGEILFSVSDLTMEQGPRGASPPPDTDEGDNPVPSGFLRSTAISGFNFAVNVTNFAARTQVDWGFFLRAPRLDAELGGLYQNLDFSRDRILSTGAYMEPEVAITEALKVRAGLVVQFLGDQGVHAEPRLRVMFEQGKHQFSLAGGIYRQEAVGLNDRRDATNIFTAWAGSPTGNLPNSIHALAGYQTSLAPWLQLSAEAFYKNLSNLFVSEWTAYPRFTTNLQEASGRAIGLDVRLEIQHSQLYGFINYGLASVEYNAMQETLPIWFGSNEVRYRPPHDRRHQVNALVSFALGKFDVGVRWNIGSGLPYSQIRGFDGFVLMDGPTDVRREPGEARVIYDQPYRGILPAYHRLDLTVERVFQHGDDSFITLQVGVINAYNQANVFALDIFTLRRNDQLPLIPTAGVKLEF